MLLARIWDAVPTVIVLTLNLMTLASNSVQDITFHLFEHPPAKKLVGNIFQAANLQGHVRSVRLDSVQSQWLSLFYLDRPTGNLYTSDRATMSLDREAICPAGLRDHVTRLTKNKCVLNLLASVNNRILIKVNIFVEDLNDNSPVFSETSGESGASLQNINVDESSIVNSTKIILKPASDYDEGGLQKIYYHLSPNDSPFYLVHKRWSESTHGLEELYMVPRQPLDYEKVQEYWVNLTACDGQLPQKMQSSIRDHIHCSTQTIHIAVRNIDDEKPVFVQKNYTVILKDSTPVGHQLVTVKAIDSDAPPYNIVRYFSLPIISAQEDLFYVEPQSGLIRLANPLPSPGVYQFFILATSDLSENITGRYADYLRQNINHIYEKPNVASVILHVISTNNHAPSVTLQISKDTSSHLINISSFPSTENAVFLQVTENTPVPTVLAYFRVTDPDSVGNVRTHCVLHSSTEIPPHLSSLLIRENMNGLLELVHISQLTEHVSIYRLVLSQGIDAEGLVKRNPDRSPIYRAEEYGFMRVAGIAPIKIHCEDNGDPVLKVNMLVYLVVIDEDEYLPQLKITLPNGTLLQPHVQQENRRLILVYSLSLKEDIAVGSTIFNLSVTDEDVVTQPVFELYENTSEHVWMNRSTATVFVRKMFDFEMNRTCPVAISVKEFYNLSSAPSKLTAVVNIHVEDINDNAPVFKYPELTYQTDHADMFYWKNYIFDGPRILRVIEEQPEGTRLGQIRAEDIDSGLNAEIRYFIVDTRVNPSRKFTTPSAALQSPGAAWTDSFVIPTFMVNNQGNLWSTTRLDRETFANIDLLVGAHDLGTPPLTSFTVIRIIITDVNDHEPRWQFPTHQDHLVVVPLDAEVGSTVTRVRAVDPDDSVHNGRVHYSLLWPNESTRVDGPDLNVQCRLANSFFKIDENNGEIMLRHSVHDLPTGFIDIWLMVKDHGKNQRYSLAKLVAYLAKPNDELNIEHLISRYRDKSQLIVNKLRMSKSLDRVLSRLSVHPALTGNNYFWQEEKNYLPVLTGCIVAGLFLVILSIIAFILWNAKRRGHLRKRARGLYTPSLQQPRELELNTVPSDRKSSDVRIDSSRVLHKESQKREVSSHRVEPLDSLNQDALSGLADEMKFSGTLSTSHANSQVFQCRQEALLQSELARTQRETPTYFKSTSLSLKTFEDKAIVSCPVTQSVTSHTYIPVNSFINFPSTIPLKIVTLSPSSYPMATCLNKSDSDQSYLNFPNIITSIVPVCHVQPDFIPICSSPTAASSTPCDSYLFERGGSQVDWSMISSSAPILLTAADPSELFKHKLHDSQVSDPLVDPLLSSDGYTCTNYTVSDPLPDSITDSNLNERSPIIRPANIN
ncbi:hypothetical protein FGIG_00301 [Fasciola gigantica]|uniref:Cadherin domain-containing protein n=1 Tax=Fasciola gigantica TaxID=46835 RepID=A0A504XMD0_FASGI|nr:hypothetical protein FGIG_00301 [Fasciola gigantica]